MIGCKKSLKIALIISAMLCCVVLVTVTYIFYGHQKVDFHTDEYYTYQLANSYSAYWEIPQYQWFFPGELEKQMTAREEALFRFDQVIEKEKSDMHPFLYTAIIHAVSSFLPNFFSPWIGIGVNIFFAIVAMIIICLTMRKLTGNPWIGIIAALFWGLSVGTVSQVVFIRMYVIVMFACTTVVYLHMKWWDKQESPAMFISMYLISVFGALIHYFFVMFLVLCCVVAFLRLLYLRKWKCALIYLLTEILAAASAILIFPAMLTQIFSKGVGYSAVAGMKYTEKISAFFGIINAEVFGGFLWILLGAAVIVGLLLLVFQQRHAKAEMRFDLWKYAFLFVPSICLVLIVSHISPYLDPRYVAGIYPCLLIAVLYLINSVLEAAKLKKKLTTAAVMLVCMVITVFGYINGEVNNLFTYRQEILSQVEKRESRQAVIVVPMYTTWVIPSSLAELVDYDELVVVDYTTISEEHIKNLLEELQAPFNIYCCTWETDEQTQKDAISTILSVVQDKQDVSASYIWTAPYCNVYQCLEN